MERRRIALGADIVVVRGLSGIMVATAMSLLHRTPIAIVRKPTENSHGSSVETVGDGLFDATPRYNDWMIVDDLISSGKTVREIHEAFSSHWTVDGDCIAIALYNADEASDGSHNIGGREIPTFDIGSLE